MWIILQRPARDNINLCRAEDTPMVQQNAHPRMKFLVQMRHFWPSCEFSVTACFHAPSGENPCQDKIILDFELRNPLQPGSNPGAPKLDNAFKAMFFVLFFTFLPRTTREQPGSVFETSGFFLKNRDLFSYIVPWCY